jgi:hypothetical protein
MSRCMLHGRSSSTAAATGYDLAVFGLTNRVCSALTPEAIRGKQLVVRRSRSRSVICKRHTTVTNVEIERQPLKGTGIQTSNTRHLQLHIQCTGCLTVHPGGPQPALHPYQSYAAEQRALHPIYTTSCTRTEGPWPQAPQF